LPIYPNITQTIHSYRQIGNTLLSRPSDFPLGGEPGISSLSLQTFAVTAMFASFLTNPAIIWRDERFCSRVLQQFPYQSGPLSALALCKPSPTSN
jgi:hypothetical protein